MTSRRLSAAMIGAGMVAHTHVAACADITDLVDLKGIYSRTRTRASELAREGEQLIGHPLCVYDSIAEIAADPEIDFVIIVTPPNARMDLIRPLAEAGKHILLEKPIGRTLAESEEIVGFCTQAGVHLGIVFQHRMRAASLKAADLIAGGDLGKLGVCEINVPWWRNQDYYDEPGRGSFQRDGGGVLISQAIHTIDLALSLAGPVKAVRAMMATSRFHKMEAEDFAVAGLEFSSGAVGSLVASTASFPGGAESIALHFDAASLRLISGQLHVHWRDGRQDSFGETGGTGGGADPMAFTHEWHQGIIEDFAVALNEGRRPVADGQAVLAAHALIDAMTRSNKSGRLEETNT